jgi:hypothetical protein
MKRVRLNRKSHKLFLSLPRNILQYITRFITISGWCSLCCLNRTYQDFVENQVPWEDICNAPPYNQVVPAARRLAYSRENLFSLLKNELARNWCAGCLTRDAKCYPMHWLKGGMLPLCGKCGITHETAPMFGPLVHLCHTYPLGDAPKAFKLRYLLNDLSDFNKRVVEYLKKRTGLDKDVDPDEFCRRCFFRNIYYLVDFEYTFRQMPAAEEVLILE